MSGESVCGGSWPSAWSMNTANAAVAAARTIAPKTDQQARLSIAAKRAAADDTAASRHCRQASASAELGWDEGARTSTTAHYGGTRRRRKNRTSCRSALRSHHWRRGRSSPRRPMQLRARHTTAEASPGQCRYYRPHRYCLASTCRACWPAMHCRGDPLVPCRDRRPWPRTSAEQQSSAEQPASIHRPLPRLQTTDAAVRLLVVTRWHRGGIAWAAEQASAVMYRTVAVHQSLTPGRRHCCRRSYRRCSDRCRSDTLPAGAQARVCWQRFGPAHYFLPVSSQPHRQSRNSASFSVAAGHRRPH